MSQELALQPRKAPTQARAVATWEAILEAAAQVLVEDGFDGATTNRIAERAGVSVGSLYQYFPNKGALLATLAERHAREMMALLAEHAEGLLDLPPAQAIRIFTESMTRIHSENPELQHLFTEHLPRLGGHDLLRQTHRRAMALVMVWLTHHAERLRVKDLDQAAFTVVTVVQGTIHGGHLMDPDRIHHPDFAGNLADLISGYLLGEPA